jgi:tRNA modification GTPase
MYAADTIVAPATAPGIGAVAIVRLSGPRAIEIARQLWHPLAPTAANRDLTPRRLYLGEIRDSVNNAPIDRAMLAVFPAPRSLTGEDVAELQCHGGSYLVRRVIALATAAGARLAEPGEFSRRAFLNGRIDLTEAEAIADLVAARGEAGLRMALAQMSGALADRVTGLRRQVIAIRAHLEIEIDFADEDIRLPSRDDLVREIDTLTADLAELHDSFARGRIIREGVRAAIIGKPNAGKSSVLNLLLGADRAIVTPIPGTTRDVIEDAIALGPWHLVVADTAGLRASDDPVERIGIERTRRHAGDSDLLIAVFDSSRAPDADDADVIATCAGRRGLAILNKRDLPSRFDSEMLLERGLELPLVELSAFTGAGLSELRDRLESVIAELAGGDSATSANTDPLDSSTWVTRNTLKAPSAAHPPERHVHRDDRGAGRSDQAAFPKSETVSSSFKQTSSRDSGRVAISHELASSRKDEIVSISPAKTISPKSEIVAISRERHRDALAHALDSLAAARQSALSAMPPEIVAVDVMAAADALGSITGVVGTEDILDALFREFCVGK